MYKTAIITVIVLIILVLIWWAVLKSKRNKIPKPVEWPPQTFMKELGGKCPDYWTYLGDNDGSNICENTYNIKTKSDWCHNKTKLQSGHEYRDFPEYKQWPPTGKALTERCKWIKKCGPSKMALDATWIGMDKICSRHL